MTSLLSRKRSSHRTVTWIACIAVILGCVLLLLFEIRNSNDKIYFSDTAIPAGVGMETLLKHQIAVFKTDRASRDAVHAASVEDWRFVGYMGYRLIVPNAPKSSVEKHGVKVIVGGSDRVLNPIQNEFNLLVRKYAEKYNKALQDEILK